VIERDLDKLAEECGKQAEEKIAATKSSRQAELDRVGLNCSVTLGPITHTSQDSLGVSPGLFNLGEWDRSDGAEGLQRLNKAMESLNLQKHHKLYFTLKSYCTATAEVTLCCKGETANTEIETSFSSYSQNY
jgi:hypothetical protein